MHRALCGVLSIVCVCVCFIRLVVSPVDYSLPGSSAHGNSPGKNTGVGCHFLLQALSRSEQKLTLSSNTGLNLL